MMQNTPNQADGFETVSKQYRNTETQTQTQTQTGDQTKTRPRQGQDLDTACAVSSGKRNVAVETPTLCPILIRNEEAISIKEAEDLTKLSAKTIMRWCKKYRIGAQSSKAAPWRISYPALWMQLHDDQDALELLRAGKREDPRVARYLDELGLPR